MRNQIVVGIDGSAMARQALLWAAQEASISDSTLLIALADDSVTGGVVGGDFRASVSHPAQNAQQLVDSAADLVNARHPSLQVSTFVNHQVPAELLTDLSESADMVVLGSPGSSRLAGALLGSTALSTAARARCPIVLVGPDVVETHHRCIVVGVSASDGGQAALRFAFAEAAKRNAKLLAVRGCGPWGEPNEAGMFHPLPGVEAEQEALLSHALSPMRRAFPQVDVTPRLIPEPIQDVMPHLSREADLVVLGRPPDHHAWTSRLGQITSIIPRQSPCPVVVVGAPEPADAVKASPRSEVVTQRSGQ